MIREVTMYEAVCDRCGEISEQFEDNGRIFKTSSRFEICEDFAGVVIIRERNNQMTECYGKEDRRNI